MNPSLLLPLALFVQAVSVAPTVGMPQQVYLSGKVRFADGKTPTERVLIERVCNGVPRREGYTDSHGEFGIQVNSQLSSVVPDASAVSVDKSFPTTQSTPGFAAGISDKDLVGCEIRASLPGYVSDTINLGFRRVLDNPFVGEIKLHPIAPKPEGSAVSVDPYKQRTLAAMAQGNWQEVVRNTGQMFKVDPDVSADFYFYSAVANYNLQNVKVAEAHAREAARRDPRHQNPKINLFLGVMLTEMKEYREAAEHLRVYLAANPSAPDAVAVRQQLVTLEGKGEFPATWTHGSEPCVAKKESAFQIHQYNDDTFILREDKCINYEGPFIYLLFGTDKVFMQDTGAAPRADSGIAFPVQETVQRIIDDWSKKHGRTNMQLIVTHSHGHGDHTGGDVQFAGQPNTTLVAPKAEDYTVDLGGRVLEIMAIPGHDAASVAVYDRKTKLLLTGDTVYPGRLYVRDFPKFKESIGRLAAFVRSHEVSYVLGTHIEMSNKDGVDYPVRTTYQPEEHTLELSPAVILELNEALMKMGDTPVKDVHKDFIISPR